MHGPEAAIYVYNEGKEDYMQVFAQMTKRDGSFLVSRKENKNFKWTDLKGSTIIPGRKGGVPYMTFEYVLKQSGLDTKKDVILDDSIKFDLMAGAFAGGKADYVTLFEPTASMTEAQEKGYIVASVGEAGGEIPYTAYFAKKSYINNNKDIIQGFTNAVYKGQTWVKEHTAKEIAEKKADEATKAMEQALKDLKVAEDKATSSEALTAETRKNNETLQTELSKAKEQLAGYDDLKKSEFENKTAVINLRHELSEKEKEYTDALKSKEVECKHQIEQIQSSAELEKEKALIAKEREMNEKIRELDRENAKLQAQIEQLQQK